MPLRRRLAFVSAVVVAIAILLAAVVCYVVVRGQLRGQVDDALRAQAAAVQRGDFHALDQRLPGIPPSAGGPAQYVQIVTPGGTVFPRQGDVSLPADPRSRAVATSGSGSYMGDLRVGA